MTATRPAPRPTRSGRPGGDPVGAVLVAAYTVFAIAAGARAAVQFATDPGYARVAHGLSALAAVVYLAGSLLLRSADGRARAAAAVVCAVEVGAVLAVGALTVLDPGLFPVPTVWTGFGSGYAWLPLVLPIAALLWLRGGLDVRAQPRRWLRGAAALEATTWAALLAGIWVEHGPLHDPAVVQLVGPLHGLAFLGYLAVVVLVVRPLRWRWWVAGLAAAASVPPFGTVAFEEWERRRARRP